MLEKSLPEIAEYLGVNVLVLEEWFGSQPSFPSSAGNDERGELWNVNEVVNFYNEWWNLEPDSPDAAQPYWGPLSASRETPPPVEVASQPSHFIEASAPGPPDVTLMNEYEEICELCDKAITAVDGGSYHYQQWESVCLNCIQNLRDEVEASGETWSDD